MTDGEVIAYKEFMWNPLNQYKCDICPENKGHDGNGFDHKYPCDQQKCWVVCHTETYRKMRGSE
jgi:hypothetical protein